MFALWLEQTGEGGEPFGYYLIPFPNILVGFKQLANVDYTVYA